MPSILVSKTLARTVFSAHQIQLGPPPAAVQVYAATTASSQQAQSTSARPIAMRTTGSKSSSSSTSSTSSSSSNQTATPMSCPPALFRAASNQKADVDYQRDQHEYYGGLLDAMVDAIVYAHSQWRIQAFFSDIRIFAAIAQGGKLNGPNLDNLIMNAPTVCGCTSNSAKLRNAVAKGIGESFLLWQNGVTVPGLPWYPAFVAWPGPTAPPMPNIPTPLISCPSPMIGEISVPNCIKNRMRSNLQSPVEHSDAFFDAIAKALAPAFVEWMPSQQIMLVLGKGPVPTFAPPYVPVGPVVGGDVIPRPGHLLA